MKTLLLTLALAAVGTAHASLISAYDFDGNLNPYINNGGHAQAMEGRAGRASSVAWAPSYTMENVNGTVKQVANFDDVTNQENFFRVKHGMSANGGATAEYVNLYSIVMDLKITSVGDWVSLYNTNAGNSNDGDAFIRDSDSGVGISGDYAGDFTRDTWHRFVLTSSTPDGGPASMNLYLDGAWVNQVGLDEFEGRWALYAWNDASAQTVDLLADQSGESGSGQISLAAFYDHALSADEVAALGGAGAPVPEPATMAVLGLGVAALLRRRSK